MTIPVTDITCHESSLIAMSSTRPLTGAILLYLCLPTLPYLMGYHLPPSLLSSFILSYMREKIFCSDLSRPGIKRTIAIWEWWKSTKMFQIGRCSWFDCFTANKICSRWYLIMFITMLALSFVVILFWDTHFTWWAMILCTALPCLFIIPIGIIYATTNISIGLNVLTEFVVGYMAPGQPLAMMMFKSYGMLTVLNFHGGKTKN